MAMASSDRPAERFAKVCSALEERGAEWGVRPVGVDVHVAEGRTPGGLRFSIAVWDDGTQDVTVCAQRMEAEAAVAAVLGGRRVEPIVADETSAGDFTYTCPACGFSEMRSGRPMPSFCQECGAEFSVGGGGHGVG